MSTRTKCLSVVAVMVGTTALAAEARAECPDGQTCGWVRVQADVSDASVLEASRLVGVTPLTTEAITGTYVITVKKGPASKQVTVTVEPGATANVFVGLSTLPEAET